MSAVFCRSIQVYRKTADNLHATMFLPNYPQPFEPKGKIWAEVKRPSYYTYTDTDGFTHTKENGFHMVRIRIPKPPKPITPLTLQQLQKIKQFANHTIANARLGAHYERKEREQFQATARRQGNLRSFCRAFNSY